MVIEVEKEGREIGKEPKNGRNRDLHLIDWHKSHTGCAARNNLEWFQVVTEEREDCEEAYAHKRNPQSAANKCGGGGISSTYSIDIHSIGARRRETVRP